VSRVKIASQDEMLQSLVAEVARQEASLKIRVIVMVKLMMAESLKECVGKKRAYLAEQLERNCLDKKGE
jgi:hypothetical protein